jgi:hypothetical protein
VARDGTLLKSVASPREISAAAFDGSVLVVADAGKLTSYDAELVPGVSADLIEGCASAVLAKNQRFVCGPENDWDRVFYTYDANSGQLLASSNKYTYKGVPMRRVPGTDDFVTVSVYSSPSDFYLYSLLESGEASFVNESPYHGDFRATGVYAFHGEPPTHLVTDEGLLLKIYGPGCTASESSFTSECFVKDGTLGTLSGAQLFLGMDSDAAGRLYGLVDASPDYFDSSCTDGCLVQTIDIASRTVLTQSVYDLDVGAIVAVRHDPVAAALVAGFRVGGSYSFDDPYPGHEVRLLHYE